MSEETRRLNVGPAGDIGSAKPQAATVPTHVRAEPIESLLLFCRSHSDWFIASGLAVLAFLNYLWTLAPTVFDGDAARFQAKAYVLGIGHPTGYPTYIMLGKLFTYVPFGDVAYRVNLSSAVYATVTIILLYFIVRRLAGPFPAVVAALAFAVSQTFWSQALIAEVYTLNTLFICATLLALILWRDYRTDRYLLLAAFLMGLSLTNHMTSGLLIPCGILLVWLTDRSRLKDWRLLARSTGLLLLGLTPYLYLPIRASMDPPMNAGDPSSLGRFLSVVLGGRFSAEMWAFGPSQLPQREAMYWIYLRSQFNIVLLALALVGVVHGFRRSRAVVIPLAVLFAGYLIFALEYNIWDISVYFIPTYLVLAICLGFAVRSVLEWERQPRSGVLRPLARVGIPVFLLLTVGLTWWTRYSIVDQSYNYTTRDLLEAVADTPRGSTIYDWHSMGMLPYLRYVEHRRQDLRVRDVTHETVEADLQQDLGAGRRVYLLDTRYEGLLSKQYLLSPEGALWRPIPNVPTKVWLATPDFRGAAEWLKANASGGSVITNPFAGEALHELGVGSVLPALTADQLEDPQAVPPDRRQQAEDVRWIYHHSVDPRTQDVLNKYDVRYIALVKRFPKHMKDQAAANVAFGRYIPHADLYQVAFENESIIIFRVVK